MSFVVYFKDDTRLVYGYNKWFATERAAKAAATRYCNKTGTDRDTVAVADELTFTRDIEKQVERKNMMSGKPYMEPINTPAYMSPSCESYWSM